MAVLSVGTSGSGKSHFVGSFPDLLVLSSDQGGATLSRIKPQPRILRFTMGDHVSDIGTWLLDAYEQDAPPFDRPTQTIAVETMTSMSTLMEFEVCMYPPDKKTREGNQLFLSDYNLIKNRLIRLVLQLLSIPVNIIVTVQPETETTDGDVFREIPSVTGHKTGPKLPEHFDVVIYHKHLSQKNKFVGYVKPLALFPFSRVRKPGGLGDFAGVIENPSHKRLVELLK